MNGTVARRYAKALFSLAKQEGRTEDVGSALGDVAQALVTVLHTGGASRAFLDEQARWRIGERLGEHFGSGSTVGKFVMLVAARGRLGELPAIFDRYAILCDLDAGRVRAQVETARPLNEADLAAIVKVFGDVTGRSVIPEVETNSQLLGGVVVEVDGRVFDGSLRTALSRLTSRMAGELSRH